MAIGVLAKTEPKAHQKDDSHILFSSFSILVCQEIMTREDEALAYRLQDEECTNLHCIIISFKFSDFFNQLVNRKLLIMNPPDGTLSNLRYHQTKVQMKIRHIVYTNHPSLFKSASQSTSFFKFQLLKIKRLDLRIPNE